MTSSRTALIFLISTLVGSCATVVNRQADELFSAGEYARAAQAYEDYLDSRPETGPETSKALYRLAITYGSASTAVYDPERAVSLLQKLLSEDPKGEYSLAAQVLLQQQKEIVSLSAVVTSRRDLIQTLIADLAQLQNDLAKTESEVGERNETVQALSSRIEHLRSEIAGLSQQLSEREAELEMLKEIDLEEQPF